MPTHSSHTHSLCATLIYLRYLYSVCTVYVFHISPARPLCHSLPVLAVAFYLFLFFYKAFLFICVCKIYARGYKIICCQDKADATRLAPAGPAAATAAAASHPLGQCQLFSSAKNSWQYTHTHTHSHTGARRRQSNCNHSVCCLSLLFYFCLHFSVSGAGSDCATGTRTTTRQSTGDAQLFSFCCTLPLSFSSASRALSFSLCAAESELCSQQYIENIFVALKKDK